MAEIDFGGKPAIVTRGRLGDTMALGLARGGRICSADVGAKVRKPAAWPAMAHRPYGRRRRDGMLLNDLTQTPDR